MQHRGAGNIELLLILTEGRVKEVVDQRRLKKDIHIMNIVQ